MKLNDLGKKLLVEECQRIDINIFMHSAKLKLIETLVTSELQAGGVTIQLTTSRTGFGGIRHWFKCPLCEQRVGTLFTNAISQNLGCRRCLNLEYRKRRYKGMVENLSDCAN